MTPERLTELNVEARDYVGEMRLACKSIGITLHSSNQFIREATEWLAKKGQLRIEAIAEEDGTHSYAVSIPDNFSADENLAMALVGLIHCAETPR